MSGRNFSSPKCRFTLKFLNNLDKETDCDIRIEEENLVASKQNLKTGESVTFKCLQPNYLLSG